MRQVFVTGDIEDEVQLARQVRVNTDGTQTNTEWMGKYKLALRTAVDREIATVRSKLRFDGPQSVFIGCARRVRTVNSVHGTWILLFQIVARRGRAVGGAPYKSKLHDDCCLLVAELAQWLRCVCVCLCHRCSFCASARPTSWWSPEPGSTSAVSPWRPSSTRDCSRLTSYGWVQPLLSSLSPGTFWLTRFANVLVVFRNTSRI